MSELNIENGFNHKIFQKLKPVKTGNLIPDIDLEADYKRWKNFHNGTPAPGQFPWKQLYGKPLTIAFYSIHWGERGVAQLQHLNAIQNEIKANGGNLLVFTNDASNEQLARIIWEHGLTLNFYHDIDNKIAGKFRIYSEKDPTWNTYSGINANIPLLAVYVIDTDRHIAYHYIDQDLETNFRTDDVITAVYESALIEVQKRSA
ncbi:MAG TPA: redoxin domain-containing protein [Mucilaginibacter sp.]|nr:redoxin domain-containing protein [Mucilaginibacter sp.]